MVFKGRFAYNFRMPFLNKPQPSVQLTIFFFTICISFLFRWAVDRYVQGVPYIVFFPAVTIIACLCSLRLSILAVVIVYLLADYFFVAPRGEFIWQAPTPNSIATACVFFLSSSLIIFICQFTQREIRRRKQAQLKANKLARALQRANDELLRSNRELEQFASVASHDLQEPLRMIANYSEMVQITLKDKISSEDYKNLAVVVDAAIRAQNLVRDLLDYATIGFRGDLKPTDMNELAQRTLANIRTAIDESRGEVHVDSLPVIQSDPKQLSRLLQNLLSNAVKYRGENPLKIQITGRELEGEWIFSVRDNGIGIAQANFKKVFEIFHRLDKQSKSKGTGLGLAICAKIAANLGGKIWVQSEEGKGSEFFFSIPKPNPNPLDA